MLCLTVYEAKGLEFDDVILYNMFALGEIRAQQWKLLNSVSEDPSFREQLPDWVLGLDEAERANFVEQAVQDALSDYKAAQKNSDKPSDEEEGKQDAEAENAAKIRLQEELKIAEEVRKTKESEYYSLKVQAAIEKCQEEGTND